MHEYAVPAAAQTVDLDETYLPRKQRRRRAGLMFAGILLLGLAAIAWASWPSGDDDSAIGSPTPVSEAVTNFLPPRPCPPRR
ncbi:MAG: hypothetical protein R2761_16370 [Acidimicrobiales bacterium]